MEKELNEHAQKLFETMPIGVVFHAQDGTISYANHAASELLGLSNAQLLGKTSLNNVWHAIHPNGEDFPGETHPAVICLKEGITIKNVVMGVFHPLEKNYKWLLINAVPEYLPNESKPYRAFITFNDITELTLSEIALKDSKFQLTERLKELNCIYQINWLNENAELTIDECLLQIVNIIPSGFQFPEKTAVQINFGRDIFQSKDFAETNSKIMIDFHLNHSKKGYLTIFNPQDTPFLKEEYALLENLKRTIEVHLNKRVVKQQLIESENRLKNLLNSQTSFVLRTNLQGLHTYWNHTFEKEFGWIFNESGMQNGNSLASICSHHHERTYKTVAECIENPGMVFKVELDKPSKEGGIKSTLWEFVCLTDENNQPFEIQCMGIDITEKTNAEAELQKFRIISDQANYGTAITSIEGEMLYVNPRFAEMHGYLPNELLGKGIPFLHSKNQIDHVTHLIEKIKTDGGFEATEVGHCKKDGTEFPTLMSAKVITNEQGQAAFLSATIIDITEKKLQEQLINEQNERLSAIIDAMPDMDFICDADGNYLEYFRSQNSLQDDYSYLLGKNVRDAFPSEIANLHVQKIRSVLNNGKMVTYEFPKVEGNVTKYFEARVVSINEKQVSRFIRDITSKREKDLEIIKLNQTLERRIFERTKELEQTNLDLYYARVLAEEANRSKSEFLSRMSHELRTPMNSILGFAQLMQMGELNDSQIKSVNHILNSGKHLLELINEVLDISRIESGKVSVSIESVNLKQCVSELLDTLFPLAKERLVSLEMSPNISDDIFIKADNQRLKQILTNLINNGIKYNKPNGNVLIEAEQLKTEGPERIRISITDNGKGILESDINKIFNPFERLNAGQTNIEGTGLGLSVVKQLVDLMNGKIGVNSKINKGSTFWVELPVGENIQKGFEKKMDDKFQHITNQKLGNILYIEDNLSNIELVNQILDNTRKGITFAYCTEGLIGFEKAKIDTPDLILLDLNLPDCHGSDILKKLLAHPITAQIPVIILSADAMADQRKKILELGAKDFLTKPIEVVSFLKTIDKYI